MPIQHYSKTLLQNVFFYAKGARVDFEPLTGNMGVKAVDSEKEKPIYDALEAAANAHKFGILRITPAEYEGLKKKRGLQPSAQESKRPERLRAFKAFNPLEQARQRSVARDVARAARGAASLSPAKVPLPAPVPPEVKALDTGRRFSPALAPLKKGRVGVAG